MLIKFKEYFVNIALPELRTNKLKSEIESSKAVTSYYFCGENEDYDNMIACDSKICPKEWHHLSCVGFKESPAGKWFCLTCKNTKGGKRKQLKKVTLKQRTKAKMVCRNNPKNRDIREKYYNLYPKLFEQCGFVIQHHKGQNLSRRMIKPEKTPVRPAKTRDHPGHLPNLTRVFAVRSRHNADSED